jgi:hypothetical protein
MKRIENLNAMENPDQEFEANDAGQTEQSVKREKSSKIDSAQEKSLPSLGFHLLPATVAVVAVVALVIAAAILACSRMRAA